MLVSGVGESREGLVIRLGAALIAASGAGFVVVMPAGALPGILLCMLLQGAGFGSITTEIEDLGEFYYAEDYHQQYLAKNPYGYCGIGGTGVSCPTGLVS